MITLTPILFAVSFVGLLLLPIVRAIGIPSSLAHAVQAAGFLALGYLTIQTGFLPLWASAVTVAMPAILLVGRLLLTTIRGFRALRGDYGEKTKWIAEYIKEDDAEFMWALKQLNQMEMREIQIEADTKQELKEIAVERANQ